MFLIYSSRDELEAEADMLKEYMESVRPDLREVFGYFGSLKYLSKQLSVLDHITSG